MSLENLIARCDHHLSSIGWGRYHTILFWICGFGWAADNMWLLLSAIFISELPTAWDLSETEAGLTAIIMMLGFLIGAYVWGYTSDVYGRMYSFRKTLLIAAFAAFGAAASVNLTMLLAFCLVAGFGIGGDVPVDGSVFIEFCPESERWRMTALGAICAMGAVIVPLFAYIFVIAELPHLWRLVTLCVCALNLVFWGIRFYVHETPKFLVTKGRIKEAAEVLSKVA